MLMRLHSLNGMAVRRVRLRERWVCEKAGLQAGADTVESLTLQGTYREKIVSLGDAFKNFKSLRSLDLSRNIIVSLQGIEYLHSLRYLNLYYNDIVSLEEVKRLRRLAELKSLDLRLNPVTRQDASYRLFVIHTAGSLEMLDERPVRESERKTAKFNFQLKSQEMPQGDMGSPSPSHLFGDRGGTKTRLDFSLSSSSELGKIGNREPDSRDYGKSSSPAKYQSEEHQSFPQPQTDFEDEYRPLPSPTRSSIRSPGPASRTKEAYRVTFADSTISELFPRSDGLSKLDKNDDIGEKNSIFSFPEKSGSALSYKNPYLTSTPVRKDIVGSEKTSSGALDGIKRLKAGGLHDVDQSTDLRERFKPSHNGEETSRERLLRLSSDLYITTHLSEPPSSSSSLSALRKGFSDISKTYTLPSKPNLTNTNSSAATAASRADFSREYRSAWSPEKAPAVTAYQSGMKRSSSLNSLLYTNPSDVYQDRHKEDLLTADEMRIGDSPNTTEAPSISEALQQLMDLVDRYWNGSGSLLHNQRFLGPARDLLTRLMTSQSSRQMSPADRGDLPDTRKSQGHMDSGDSPESVKLKLVKVMEENHFLRSKIHKLESQANRKEGAGNLVQSQDDLRHKYEHLSLQVDSLQQQLNKTNKLQETVNQLHNSQRSLVSTNEYLMQQLNKISPSAISRPARESSPQRGSTDKYQDVERSDLLSLMPAYSANQYRKPERLSACPL